MAISDFQIYPVTVASTQIDGIESVDFDDGSTPHRPVTDGNIDPFFSSISSIIPRARFTTRAVATALGVISPTVGVTGSVVGYEAKITSGARASGSNHQVVTISSARTLPRTLTCAINGDAMLSCESIGYNASGSNTGMTRVGSSALASFTPGSDELFTLGPVQANGTTLEGIEGISVDFGLSESIRHADGYLLPKNVDIMTRMPTVSLTINDMDQVLNVLTASDTSGLAIDVNGLVIYLKKRATDGLFVDDATTSHIKLTFAAGLIFASNTTGNPRTGTITIAPRAGASAILQYSGGSAIT